MLATQSARQLVTAPEWSPVSAMSQETAQRLADLFRSRYPDLAKKVNGRIERAVQIVSTPGACKRNATGTVWVKSLSNPDPRAGYEVDLDWKTCTCPDSGKGNLCQHRLAAGFHIFGPDWITEQQAEKVKAAHDAAVARHAAFKASEDAWHQVSTLADLYEQKASTLRPDGTYPSDEEISYLRTRMLQAVEIASDLAQKYNQLIALDHQPK